MDIWGGKRWWLWLGLVWLGFAAWMISSKWGAIIHFGLGDTDDNLRYLQVRDWLNGQSWFDLRQHRLGPPDGANIHWSRLVDLPIAGLYLLSDLFVSPLRAWQVAYTVAPLLPLLAVMAALAVIVRRMIGRPYWPVALLVLTGGVNALYMWMPLRIDHHGWQLALLAWTLAGMTDPRPKRGGLTAGVASALSLAIGLEFVHFLLLVAALAVFDWSLGLVSAVRLRMHGIALGLGALLMWLVFASYDNRAAVCDALSPVWLLVAMGGGGVMTLLAGLDDRRPWLRLLLAASGALPVALAYGLLFPQCLGAPEGMSPELKALWFVNIREVKSVMTRDWPAILSIMTVPAFGFVGALLGWYREKDERRAARWRALVVLSIFSLAMLLWQTRAAASAQLIGVLGATMLVAAALHGLNRVPPVPRFGATVLLLALVSGLAGQWVLKHLPRKPAATGYTRTVAQADRECQSAHFLRQIEAMPIGLVMTHVDLGPRLIAMTHHRAVAGPYHRNGKAIVDVMRFFRGSTTQAERIARRWKLDYVLVCPGMPESTIYRARNPDGLYMKLMANHAPRGLEAVPLPTPTPYRLWRVKLSHAVMK
jgi:hypothetical protein